MGVIQERDGLMHFDALGSKDSQKDIQQDLFVERTGWEIASAMPRFASAGFSGADAATDVAVGGAVTRGRDGERVFVNVGEEVEADAPAPRIYIAEIARAATGPIEKVRGEPRYELFGAIIESHDDLRLKIREARNCARDHYNGGERACQLNTKPSSKTYWNLMFHVWFAFHRDSRLSTRTPGVTRRVLRQINRGV